MEISFNCPRCEAELSSERRHASLQIKCPCCAAAIQIPAPGEEPRGGPGRRIPKTIVFLIAALSLALSSGVAGAFFIGIYRFFELPVYDHVLVPFYALVLVAIIIFFHSFYSMWKLVSRRLFSAGMLLLMTIFSFAFSAAAAVFVADIIFRIFGAPQEYSQHLVPFYILIFLVGFFTFLFSMTLGRLAYELKKFLRERISLFKFLSILARQIRILDIFLLGKK